MPVQEIQVRTPRHDCMVDITAEVRAAVAEMGVTDGQVLIYCPHTTAAITINENADPDVTSDMMKQLTEMVPWRQPFYDHGEGNSAAHVKSSMFGCSETVPISGSRLLLGTWQGIYFAEFDGPRNRTVILSVIGS